jgi:hypothetical protein
MRVARLRAFAMVAICVAAGSVFADPTAPVIAPQVTGTLGNNGWYVSDVMVSWTVTDPDSAVTSTFGCGTTLVTIDTTGNTYTCSATSGGGTSSASVTVKRDTTPPVIDFVGDQPTYTVDETIAIFCNTFDAISGVASTTCMPLAGLATDFPLETPITHSATATDNAGNTITGMTTFTVEVDYAGMIALATFFSTKDSLDRQLERLLLAAQAADLAGDLDAEQRAIDHFIATATRNEDRNIDPDDVALLVDLAGYL